MLYNRILENLVSTEPYENPIDHKPFVSPDYLHVMQRLNPNTGQRLTVLGSAHINDPSHWYYNLGAKLFFDWLRSTFGLSRLMIHEGESDLVGYESAPGTAIIKHYGEVGLVRHLATKFGIVSLSGGPRRYSDVVTLIQEFGAKETALFYGLREIPLWHRMQNDRPSLKAYLEKVLEIYRRKLEELCRDRDFGTGVSDSLHLFSYKEFRQLHHDFFGNSADPESEAMNEIYLGYTKGIDPAGKIDSATARAGRRCLELCDAHLGAEIIYRWSIGQSVFVWYGMLHTIALSRLVNTLGVALPAHATAGRIWHEPDFIEKDQWWHHALGQPKTLYVPRSPPIE